jgi:hypothetical protein
MTDQELSRFVDACEDTFVSTQPLTETQRKRLRFMLGDLDGSEVSYREAMFALRELANRGQKHRPVAGEILSVVRTARTADGVVSDDRRARFVQEFQSACRIYGRKIAVELLDPHGEHADWIPAQAPGHVSHVWGKARAQLVELNVLGDR